MKAFNILLAILAFPAFFFSQGEEAGPLSGNPDLYNTKTAGVNQKINAGTFDSTFIYKSDTLSLPFIDEFSKNHFETYAADFTDPGVTSDKKYRILDNGTLLPIPNALFFTEQQTFRRIFNLETATFIDQNFSATPYKVGDLSNYPVDYTTTNLFPPYYIYDTIGTPDISDTVWITSPEFFQDSATQFFANLNNPNAYWLDNRVYHNYRYAFEPRSLGVATFDGLDASGFPYQIGSVITNYADFLTSKPLDLQGLGASDSVYFSFLYQIGGFGDIPESMDSLVLEFYAKDYDQWNRVWSVSPAGLSPEEFTVGHIRLEDPLYFKKGFQFRFKNYGSLAGNLDHFHIDYVHLRKFSGYQDTLFKDFAFVYPTGSLLQTYTSVPWDHFVNNPLDKMNQAARIVVHNGSNLPENNQDGEVKISYSGTTEGTFLLNGTVLSGGNINYGPQTTYSSFHDLSGGYVFDISKSGNDQTFDVLTTASAQFPNFAGNDSTFSHQYFSNYYSYDDGSAEKAYGPTSTQARLAVKYTAYEADSLIGLLMHFAPTVNDVSDKLFLLTVWADNGGVPGAVLYEDNVFFPRSPIYGTQRNEFIPYYFEDTMKVACGNTFFVGWRQFDAERLNIGLDLNLDNSDKTFYSINNGVTWNQSAISGSVMIRPIVSTNLDVSLNTAELSNTVSAHLFPNPTTDDVTIRMVNGNYAGVEVLNMIGETILRSTEETISLQNYPNGMYFFKIIGTEQVYKIVKN